VTIAAGETVQGDLIASAGTVRIDGRVDGDLVATGGQVTVAGTVTGDVLVAAGSTTISGQIDGDARLAAGQARVQRQGRVGEDLLVAAGQTTVAQGAQVGGDLIFGTGQMQMDGAVAGNVLGSTGNYTEGGSVGGSERVNVGQPEEQQEPPTLADRAVDALRRYVSILVIGALLLWLLPRMFRGGADAARGRPLVSFGVGILGFIGVIVALVLLILVTVLVAILLGLLGLGSLTGVTVFGGLLTAAAIVFLFVLAVAFAAQATVGLALGRLLLRSDGRSFLGSLGALALGVLLVVLVAAIPLAGGWLEALLVLLGLGALLLMARPARRQVAEPVGSASPSSL
jgi:cytoskeletal protein CcmA (bactofilin family)